MARVVVGEDNIDIRVSLLERMMLAERSRKLPLSRVRGVNPHPPLLDLMVHWADRGDTFLLGNASYEGHIIPGARNPRNMLSIELDDEPSLFIEVDEAPELVAERISRAIGSQPPAATTESRSTEARDTRLSELARQIEAARRLEEQDDDAEEGDEGDGGYDEPSRNAWPLDMSEALSEHERRAERVSSLQIDHTRHLTRLGSWFLGLGGAATVAGAVVVALGNIPGLLAVGAGVVCAAIGATALAVVAHQQS